MNRLLTCITLKKSLRFKVESERNIPFASTLNRKDFFNVFQVIWNSQFRENHFFKFGLCFNYGSIRSDFQEGRHDQHSLEIFKNIPSGFAAFAYKDKRDSFSLLMRGDSFITNLFRARHRFQYGFQLRYCSSFSQKEIAENIHLHFFEEKPLEIIKFNTPVEHRESEIHLNFFAQDTITFSNFLSTIFGFHLASKRLSIIIFYDTSNSYTKRSPEVEAYSYCVSSIKTHPPSGIDKSIRIIIKTPYNAIIVFPFCIAWACSSCS